MKFSGDLIEDLFLISSESECKLLFIKQILMDIEWFAAGKFQRTVKSFEELSLLLVILMGSITFLLV